jgi:hypothetical protein
MIGLLVTLLWAAGTIVPGLAAPLRQDNVLNITYPTAGSVLSGEVTIQGTATHPNFQSYGVLFATGSQVTGSTGWQMENPIVWDQRSMVVNGALGTWDTTQVPNGNYVMALVMYEVGNETPQVHFINNLTVNNEEATPTPEPTATTAPVEGEGETGEVEEPLAPPAEAPTIEQPPTATPRPTPTVGAEGEGENVDDDGEGGLFSGENLFSVDAVKEAFTLGVQLAFLLYAAGMLYVLAKAVIRYYLRQNNKSGGLKGGGMQGPGSKEPSA